MVFQCGSFARIGGPAFSYASAWKNTHIGECVHPKRYNVILEPDVMQARSLFVCSDLIYSNINWYTRYTKITRTTRCSGICTLTSLHITSQWNIDDWIIEDTWAFICIVCASKQTISWLLNFIIQRSGWPRHTLVREVQCSLSFRRLNINLQTQRRCL